nr:protein HEAT INTOLERANT 4-like [Nicotiana tomentosiformis]
MRKGTKREATEVGGKDKSNEEEPPQAQAHSAAEQSKSVHKIAKRETEYFPDKRNLKNLWQEVFPVGTEWDHIYMIYQYKWNFSNLEDAFEQGGELHGEKVYLFGCTEPQLVYFQGQSKVICIPVVSPFPRVFDQ